MSAETDTRDGDGEYSESDRRPAVKARFDPDVFERINQIRRDRGVEWSTVVLMGIAEVETEIPPYHRRYGQPKDETTTTGGE